jgi:hypothetical protein
MAKPRGMSFQPGNTASRGRPLGSRNQAMEASQSLFGEYSETLTRKCILLGIQGDRTALHLCMERVLPPCRSTPVHFEMPAVRTLADLPAATNAVMQATAAGEITPTEGQQMMDLLEGTRRNFETVDVEKRLRDVEEQVATKKEP